MSDQLALFDAKTADKIVCGSCGRPRPAAQFAWADQKHTHRDETVCNTCRANGGERRPPRGDSYSPDLISAPTPLPLSPAPMRVKAGDMVKLLINDETTGLTIVGVLRVIDAIPTKHLRKYIPTRNFYIQRGYHVAQIRGSVALPALRKVVNGGS